MGTLSVAPKPVQAMAAPWALTSWEYVIGGSMRAKADALAAAMPAKQLMRFAATLGGRLKTTPIEGR